MGRKSIALSLSLPPDMALEYERIAKKQKKSKSELLREMFNQYKINLEKNRFYDLQRYGAKKIQKLNIRSEKDIEKLIFEDR